MVRIELLADALKLRRIDITASEVILAAP